MGEENHDLFILRPHIMGEENHDLLRFFTNFAKSPQSPPFYYLTILYSNLTILVNSQVTKTAERGE